MPANADRDFSVSIAEIYDQLLVPLLFQAYAKDLSHRVEKLEPRDVLELAAGTGVVTRLLASRLPSGTRVVATDLNEPMLAFAKAKQPPGRAVEWRHADALSLPFEDNAFDVVVCQFGAMFFPDKVKAFGEARRVLKPGGHFVFSVWDRISENEFADVVTEALAQRFPDDPPRFMARVPHGYHDVAQIRAELNAAGFTKVVTEVVEEISRASSPYAVARAYCQGTPLRAEIESRDPSGLEPTTVHATTALAQKFGAGPLEGRIQAIVITATR
jgi:ubiquinone/menaquinone biosynthesis C-methylase UbiE